MLSTIKPLLDKFWELFDETVFFITKRYVKKIFLAGESINEGLATAVRLNQKGYGITYHVMAEDLTDRRLVQANVRINIELLRRAHAGGLSGNLAVKLSAFGGSLPHNANTKQGCTSFNETEAQRHLKYLLHAVRDIPDIEIEIDAEEYHTLSGTQRVIEQLSLSFPDRLRFAVQMHVPDFYARAERSAYKDKKVRIVRGAGVYKDEATSKVVNQNETDKRALWLMTESIGAGRIPYLGTLTNSGLFEKVLDTLDERHLSYDILTLESLYGSIGRSLRHNAKHRGVRVVVYTPIVVDWCIDAWKPYCRRRIPMMRKYFWNLTWSKMKKVFGKTP